MITHTRRWSTRQFGLSPPRLKWFTRASAAGSMLRPTSRLGGCYLAYQELKPTTPAKGMIIPVHGLGGHAGRYLPICEFFTQKGYFVYPYDLRGHGLSGGTKGDIRTFGDYINDLDLVIQRACTDHPQLPVYVFAVSMGSVIALEYLRYRAIQLSRAQGPEVQGMAFWGVPAKPGKAIAYPLFTQLAILKTYLFRPQSYISLRSEPTLATRNPQVLEAMARGERDPLVQTQVTARLLFQLRTALKRIVHLPLSIRVPALFAHGGIDQIADRVGAERVFSQYPGKKEWVGFPEFPHDIASDPHADQVLLRVTEWFAEHERK